MLVFADHLDFARTLLPSVSTWEPRRAATLQPPVRHLATRLQPDAAWHAGELAGPDFDRCLLVARSSHSQFDVLRDLATANRLPEGSTFCVAGSGLDFHGYRGRSWTAVAGNLHVSLVFAPGADIAHFGAVFMALPAVATASRAPAQPLEVGAIADRRLRIAPERVHEDTDRSAGGANVLDLAAGDPVVDGSPAHARINTHTGRGRTETARAVI